MELIDVYDDFVNVTNKFLANVQSQPMEIDNDSDKLVNI